VANEHDVVLGGGMGNKMGEAKGTLCPWAVLCCSTVAPIMAARFCCIFILIRAAHPSRILIAAFTVSSMSFLSFIREEVKVEHYFYSSQLLVTASPNDDDGGQLLRVHGGPLSPLKESDELSLERFRRRRTAVASAIEAELSRRPPSNLVQFADAKAVVTSVLDGLRCPHVPAPYFGYEILYTSSTERWREVLRKRIGAPSKMMEEGLIFRALGTSIERPRNQFAILVRTDMNYLAASDDSDVEFLNGRYEIEFPQDTLDYYDGTAWLECRLRDGKSDALLAVLGWSMKRREDDGAWLIDGIDWQDFRDEYRPGIGRVEWERICG